MVGILKLQIYIAIQNSYPNMIHIGDLLYVMGFVELVHFILNHVKFL